MTCYWHEKLIKLGQGGCEHYREQHIICQIYHPLNSGEDCGTARHNSELVSQLLKEQSINKEHSPGLLARLFGFCLGVKSKNK